MATKPCARFTTLLAALLLLTPAAAAWQNTDEIAQLKAQVEDLRQQLEAVSKKLDAAAAAASRPLFASTTPMVAPVPAAIPASMPAPLPVSRPAPPARPAQQPPAPESPLQLKIGDAYITPIGFMDFTGVWRNKNDGGSIGTSFGSINYGNIYQTNLSEFRLSMQNSRIGFRVDANVKGAHVIGYMEADFLGNNGGNVLVSSNSNTLRSRLYWVDLAKGSWEVLGGQTWSLITPGKSGISPLPSNLAYTQVIDVNYQAGLVWGRIPELRLVYHASDKAALALALDNPEQYVGGSSGGPTPTFPAALTTYAGGELNNGGTTTAAPNVAPDVIAKLAFDPSSHAHIEFGGVERNFKVWNPNNQKRYSAQGAGGFLNLNFEVAKGFRLVTNNFWSDGGGRYIFGQAPDLIARADGSLSPIHSGSTVSGFEFTHGNALVYAYYGGIYVGRNSALDTNEKLVGYGYTGSASSNNRAIQEGTLGLTQTIWKDARYGALQLMFQYSYVQRNPWYVAAGQPSNASVNMAFFNLRYLLPGMPPP